MLPEKQEIIQFLIVMRVNSFWTSYLYTFNAKTVDNPFGECYKVFAYELQS